LCRATNTFCCAFAKIEGDKVAAFEMALRKVEGPAMNRQMQITDETNGSSRLVGPMEKAAAGLHRTGLFGRATMRGFDTSCLTSVQVLTPREIVELRTREGVSQGVFAKYLNVRPKLVSEWERGQKKPSGPSLKLLAIVNARGLDAIM
jgi:putative transcriptional regulator